MNRFGNGAGGFTPDVRDRFHERLRREPGEHGYGPQVVPGSLPVLFFGDMGTARVATVGLNPSRKEYSGEGGGELDGPSRRLETLRSLGAVSRAALTAEQCDAAITRMRGYFLPGRPIYPWFGPLNRVTSGMGVGYATGGTAHLDLVQEATTQIWSDLTKRHLSTLERMRDLDLRFLRWELEAFSLEMVLCDGATASQTVRGLFDKPDVYWSEKVDKLPGRKVWLENVRCNGRGLWLCGWDFTLNGRGVAREELAALGGELRALLVN